MFPTVLYAMCKAIGFGLLFASWSSSGEATGFFPIIILGTMTAVRHRFPKLQYSIVIDCAVLLLMEQLIALSVLVLPEIFYRTWKGERERGLKLRDREANRYYELEQLQGDLLAATAQVERMTAASERARIAAEIHDNAGHEIIGAYMSLQATRSMLDAKNGEALALYDEALQRLGSGVNKIREAVHNLAPVIALGVETLRETCNRFPACEVQFSTYGNLSAVPIYGWNLLEACLNEALTNIVRHAEAKHVSVDLDVTPNIIRLCIENDGSKSKLEGAGIGLRNLRHRAGAVGGNISVDAGEAFRVICVIPIGASGGESI